MERELVLMRPARALLAFAVPDDPRGFFPCYSTVRVEAGVGMGLGRGGAREECCDNTMG